MEEATIITSLVRRLRGDDGLEALFSLWAWRPYTVRLQGGWDRQRFGRYTFLGVDPYAVLSARGDVITLRDRNGSRRWRQDPFSALAAAYEEVRREPRSDDLPFPFQGGAMGFLGYELRHFVERGTSFAKRDLGLPDLFFAFFDLVVAYDHLDDRTYLLSTGLPYKGAERVQYARRRMDQLLTWIDESGKAGPPLSEHSLSVRDPFTILDEGLSAMSKQEYVRMVERAKAYIASGDVYQVNLAQRFRVPLAADPEILFNTLKSTNPAPFGAYLRGRQWSVISVSPERFLCHDGRSVETRPIKGTRPRNLEPAEDKALRAELLSSAKDRAEHVMIVDLERNDLGRFCRPGSVHVPELMIAEAHPTVWHMVSSVVGEPEEPEKIIEGVRAGFPGGSITGAPKVRAMEIIDELEPVARGVYTGSIGYLGVAGRVDLNIAIRTLTVWRRCVYFHVGGGIVADSDPDAEYQETLDKGLGIAQALAALA